MSIIKPPDWEEYRQKFGEELGLAVSGRTGEMLIEILAERYENLMSDGLLTDEKVTLEELRAHARCYRDLIVSIQEFRAAYLLKLRQKEEREKWEGRKTPTELIPGLGRSSSS